MSTLSVSTLQNTASPVTNVVLNADGSSTVALYNAAVAPTPTQTGTLWYDISGAGLVIWNGAAWVGFGGGGLTAATLAQAAAGTLNTVALTPESGVPKDAAGMTGAAILPSGTTAQRPAAPASGMVRVNTDTNPQLEQYANGTWQPIGVITSNLTLNVATTGNDTTGLGTAAAPWATPHKAMSYLSNYAIAQGVTVTVSVADGAYTFTTPLNLNHPNGSQIFINGGTTSGVRPTGAALNGGGIQGNTAGTEAFNDALLKAYYNTQWQFNGCHGLLCSTGGNVTVNTVLIRGNGAGGWSGVLAGNFNGTAFYASSGGINLGNTVAVHNFGGNGITTIFGGSIAAPGATISNIGAYGMLTNFGGSIFAEGATASNNGIGIFTNFGGSIFADSVTASNNSGFGIATSNGGSIYAASAIAANNNAGIIANFGGSIFAGNAVVFSNGESGIGTNYGGFILANGATASFNNDYGIFTNLGGYVSAVSATASNNAVFGIYVYAGGSILAQSATATGNGTTDILANRAGIIRVPFATYGTISPALNSVGNLNAATST